MGLAFVAFSAPLVGTLHGLNAIALLAVPLVAAHRARRPAEPAAGPA